MGTWIHLPGPAIKCLSNPGESDSINSAMFFFHLLPWALSTLLDPPWSILFLWRSWAARRILVHRVIVSPILAPCCARESATTARRSLVISPVSSHHACRAVLVFARAKMCGHFPLSVPLNAHQESHRLLSHSFSIYWEIGWAHARRAIFLFLGTILSTGQCRFVSRWPSALWGSGLPSIQRSLDRLISGQRKFFVSVPRYFVIWGSNKFESVIYLLSVPWILGVLFCFRF